MACKIRILVVDDSAFVRRLLREALTSQADMDVVGWACDGLEALSEIARLKPDVITLDRDMPHCDGLGVLVALRGFLAPPAVVVLTADDDALHRELIARGAAMVVRKTSEATMRLDELIDAVRASAPKVPSA